MKVTREYTPEEVAAMYDIPLEDVLEATKPKRKKPTFSLRPIPAPRDEGNPYQELLRVQGRCCAICGTKATVKRPLVIDHDHETGLTRGLLCVPCNAGLGQFRDSTKRLNNAIKYLLNPPCARRTIRYKTMRDARVLATKRRKILTPTVTPTQRAIGA